MTELQHEIKNPTFAAMTLAYVSTSTLRTRPRQVRRHTQSKIRRLAKFMEQSRVIVPLVVDQENVVVLGNARLQALNLLGVDSAPVIRVTHLDEAMIRALILADNQFTLNADWYKEALREELLHLAPLVVDFGLELTDLGFETGQLDFTIGEIELAGNGDSLLPPPAKPLTKQGYLWIMGPHILACGDARHEKTYASVLDTSLADMVFGDLPYNVPVLGHVSGNGAIQHKEFAMASGEMAPEEFIAFMLEIFRQLRKFSKEGSVHFHCMDWRHSLEMLTAAKQAGYEYLNMACWVKHAGGMGSLYRSQHELIHVFKSGSATHTNNVMLGKFGRNRTNVWHYDGANSFSSERRGDLELHSTTKPIDMIADAIKDCSNRGDIILDPTAGAGSTLIAAERTNRIARLIEIDAQYCDTIVRRWQSCTGKKAILTETGQTFDEMAALAGGNHDE